jgi:hypothetical protein
MKPSLLLQQTTSHIAALDDEDLQDLAEEVAIDFLFSISSAVSSIR